jgi:hypothetical protein
MCDSCGHSYGEHFRSNDGSIVGCGMCYQFIGMIDAESCNGFIQEEAP